MPEETKQPEEALVVKEAEVDEVLASDLIVDDPSQDRTRRNIGKALAASLSSKYRVTNKDKLESFLKIHGLHKDNFDFIGNIQLLFREKLSDTSIDDNANKSEKTIRGIITEVLAPIQKAIGYDILYQTMREMFGKKEAKRLSGELYDLSLAISDSTKLLIPYCWSFDASKLVLFGRPFGQLKSRPPKRIDSYIASLTETVHQMSNHLAGAIAIGTLFLDLTHIMIYKENVELTQLKKDKNLRKLVENELQTFVHAVNHLSRLGVESPFTNVSIFDRIKLKVFVKEMEWYFPGVKTGTDEKGNPEYDTEQIEYIISFITELQEIYLDFFDEGDPEKGGMPYRFPVTTINLSVKKIKNKETKEIEYNIEDKRFLHRFCRREVYRYNIFASEGNKIASCCRLLSDTEMLGLASQSNSFGAGSSISLGSHRVVTTNINRMALEAKSVEGFYKIMDQRIEDAAKILKAHKELIKLTTDHGLQMFIKLGWIQIDRMFSTFGLLGEVEAAETLHKKFGVRTSKIKIEMITHYNSKVMELSTKYNIHGNIEQIPAESMAVRLVNADRILFGKEKVPQVLYSNQFVPLWENATIWERLEEDGKLNKLITGGGIVHAQIGEKVTPKQAEYIMQYAIKCGCEHFALNAIYSECINKHTSFGKHDKCPNCQAKITTWYTRVVGFFTPINDWKKERREWEFPKRKFVNPKEDKDGKEIK